MKNAARIKLSDFELEVMQLLWVSGEASAPHLHQEIAAKREVAYSTVRTIVDRLVAKGAIAAAGRSGRTVLFRPVITEQEVRAPLTRRFVERVFGGQTRPLLSQLVENEALSDADIRYLQKLLEDKRQGDHDK